MSMQEDVYETNDLPESEQNQQKEETFESEHIEKIKLNVGNAYNNFKGKALETEGADFSDSVSKTRKGYYGRLGGSYLIEYVRPVDGEPETVLQQYQRLQNEIKELAGKLEDTKDSHKSKENTERLQDVVTAANVSELQQNLKQLQIEQILGVRASSDLADPQSSFVSKILEAVERSKQQKQQKHKNKDAAAKGDSSQQLSSNAVTYELYCSDGLKQSSEISKLGDLEAKLSAIEKFMGNDSDKLSNLLPDTKCRNLIDVVETIQQRLQILDMNQIELVDTKLSILLHKLAQVKEKRTNLDAEQSGRLNDLYEMMKKWDGLCSSLPQIVSRLQSLKDLHEQALQMSQSVTYLDGAQQELTKALDSNVSLLNEIKETLGKNVDTFKSNCENIDKRLKAVLK